MRISGMIGGLGWACAAIACTYAPPELQTRIANHTMSNDGQVAFAVNQRWAQRPTGLSTFPDGGRWRILREASAIYWCNVLTAEVQRLWAGKRPGRIESGYTAWVGPWAPDGLYFSQRGYPTDAHDHAEFVRRDFRLRPDGGVDVVVDVPAAGVATSEPRLCAIEVVRQANAEFDDIIGTIE